MQAAISENYDLICACSGGRVFQPHSQKRNVIREDSVTITVRNSMRRWYQKNRAYDYAGRLDIRRRAGATGGKAARTLGESPRKANYLGALSALAQRVASYGSAEFEYTKL